MYWEEKSGEPESPLGDAVANAEMEGYSTAEKMGPQPYFGYSYRILTSQGNHAPGGAKNYLKKDELTGGFAPIAYPAKWNVSGVMTFMMNQDGVIYEKNLGEDTQNIASHLIEFDPDNSWKPVGWTD